MLFCKHRVCVCVCVCVCVEDIVIESFVSKTSWSLFQRQKSYDEFCVVFFEDANPRRFGNEFFDFGATCGEESR